MRWTASWPEAFEAVFADPGEGVTVYRVRPDPAFLQAYGLYLSARADLLRSAQSEGLAKLRRALRLCPRLAGARSAYGTALLLRGDLKGAERESQKALALQPDQTLALLNLARVQARTGRRASAWLLLSRAKASAEDWGVSQAALAGLERELSDSR